MTHAATTVRLDAGAVVEADALASDLCRKEGRPVRRADVLRRALTLGLSLLRGGLSEPAPTTAGQE